MAHEAFKKAQDADPSYAPAWVGQVGALYYKLYSSKLSCTAHSIVLNCISKTLIDIVYNWIEVWWIDFSAIYCIALTRIVSNFIASCCIVSSFAALYCIGLYWIVWHLIALHCIALSYFCDS